MTHSVTKGVLSNGAAMIAQKIIRILDQLLLIPFFLVTWGASYYGEWLTLTIIPSVLAFSDLGFGSAVSNSFVLAYASGDKQKAANLNKSGYFVISCSVILGGILTLLVMFVGKQMNLFQKSLIPANEAMISVTFIIVAKLIAFYLQLIEGYFRATRKAALGSFLFSGQSLINLISGFCVLLIGCGVVGYAMSQFIVSIVFTIIYFIIGNKLIDLKNYQGKMQRSDIKVIISKGIGYMMTPIWQSIYFQGGTFVVHLALGPESVAIFNTIRTLCRSINQMFSIVNGSIFPELQYEYGKGNMFIVHRLFRIAVIFSIFIGIVGTLFLMLFGLEIYEWWTRNILSVPTNVWITFMVGILFNAIWWTSVVSYRMTNQPYHFAIMSTIVACISVCTSYILAKHLNLWGAALGAVLYDFIMMFYVLPDSCKLLGMTTKDIFSHIKDDSHFIIEKLRHTKVYNKK